MFTIRVDAKPDSSLFPDGLCLGCGQRTAERSRWAIGIRKTHSFKATFRNWWILILIVNLIVARLAATYKKYNRQRHLLVHLNSLNVREIYESDEKYSAMVSAPFPLNCLHFLSASLLINMKSPTANAFFLHIYYFPIAVLSFLVFSVYQVAILPFCYVKLIGHKFALMIKSP